MAVAGIAWPSLNDMGRYRLNEPRRVRRNYEGVQYVSAAPPLMCWASV